MDINSFYKVILFLKRPEILDFCYKALNSSYNIYQVDDYDFSTEKKGHFVIIEPDIFRDPQYVEIILSLLDRTSLICIIPFGTEASVCSFCEDVFSNILYFPCSELQLQSICDDYMETVQKEYPFLTSETDINVDNLEGYFLGTSKAIKEIREKIIAAANNSLPVLLLGETGTGKSTAARVIHQLSVRRNHQLFSVNIPTIVDTLASSEFFGTEQGAYTDAVAQKGLFRQAHKSTLILEEMGLASEKIQTVLLQILEHGEIKSVGSDRAEKIDVRMIYTTNADMMDLLQKGQFRNDLYHRISDTIIVLPALRDRPEDIKILVLDILKDNSIRITEEALNKLEKHNWPGNIRELNQCVQRAIRECSEGIIQESDINFGLFDN